MEKIEKVQRTLQRYNGNFYQISRWLIPHLGFFEAAFLDVLIKHGKMVNKEYGEFYCISDKITQNTGISYRTQKRLIETLVEKKILSYKVKGIPAKKHFIIDYDYIEELMLLGVDKVSVPCLNEEDGN